MKSICKVFIHYSLHSLFKNFLQFMMRTIKSNIFSLAKQSAIIKFFTSIIEFLY